MFNQNLIDKIREIELSRNNNRIDLIVNANNELQLPIDGRSLATKKKGLYWLETNASNIDLQSISVPTQYTKGLVPIKKLAARNSIYPTKPNPDGMRVVYNGIRTDIRSRIQSHLRKTGAGTGRLGLNAYPELTKFNWRISYYILEGDDYELHSVLFETGWRGHYGFPILCRE